MKIGRKLYYDKTTGQAILLTDEQNSQFAVESTKEQDFARYRELMGRNPESVDFLQLDYGQYRGDFEKATSYCVNLETKAVEFELPEVFQSHEATINELRTAKANLEVENSQLKVEVAGLKEKNTKLEEDITNAQVAIAEIFETTAPTEGGTV